MCALTTRTYRKPRTPRPPAVGDAAPAAARPATAVCTNASWRVHCPVLVCVCVAWCVVAPAALAALTAKPCARKGRECGVNVQPKLTPRKARTPHNTNTMIKQFHRKSDMTLIVRNSAYI